MKEIIVTTSWDDGPTENLQLLKLLEKYNLKGTFYIPQNMPLKVKKGNPLKKISEDDIIKIAKSHEIGAHTLNHPHLDKLDKKGLYREIRGSKKWLENLLKKPIKMFAYPYGIYNGEIIKLVKECGFLGARTVESFKMRTENPFLMGVTFHCYPHFSPDAEWSLFFKTRIFWERLEFNLRKVFDLNLPINSLFGWAKLGKNVFKYVLKNGGIFHLFGHPWEVEKYNLWDDLEKVFKCISNRENILYLTNSEVLERTINNF